MQHRVFWALISGARIFLGATKIDGCIVATFVCTPDVFGIVPVKVPSWAFKAAALSILDTTCMQIFISAFQTRATDV